MLACHTLLNAMSSRTKSPELPSGLVMYGTVTVLPTDFMGCQRSGTVGPDELETESPQSETFAQSHTLYENCKRNAAAEEVHMAGEAHATPRPCGVRRSNLQ